MVELKPIQTIPSNVLHFKMSMSNKAMNHPNTGGTFGKFKLASKQNCKIAPKQKAIMSPLTTVPSTKKFISPIKNYQNGHFAQPMRVPEVIARPPTINSQIVEPSKIIGNEPVKPAGKAPEEIPKTEENNDKNNNTDKNAEIKDNKENMDVPVATPNVNKIDTVVATSTAKPEEQDSTNDSRNKNNSNSDSKENILATCNPKRVLMDDVNSFITCNLCKGYLIDATTIVECLHTCEYIFKWI